mgnify:CR=1 FL=1
MTKKAPVGENVEDVGRVEGSEIGKKILKLGGRALLLAILAGGATDALAGQGYNRSVQVDESKFKNEIAMADAKIKRNNEIIKRNNREIKGLDRESDESAARMRILVEQMKKKHGLK